MADTTLSAEAQALDSAAYDMIDRFLRNNLSDEDYADYSQALDRVYLASMAAPQGEPVARKAVDAWANKHSIRFVSRSSGQYTTDTISRDALMELAAPQPVAREPLSEERIEELWVEHGLDDCDPQGFARLVEREHGIAQGEQP